MIETADIAPRRPRRSDAVVDSIPTEPAWVDARPSADAMTAVPTNHHRDWLE